MDAFLQAILAGLAANILTTVPVGIASALVRHRKAQKDLLRLLASDLQLRRLIQRSTAAVVKRLARNARSGAAARNLTEESLVSFACSEYVTTVLREIYATSLSSGARDQRTVRAIRDDFISSFRGHFPKTPDDRAGSLLFDMLTDAIDRALAIAVENGMLSAHDARVTLMYRDLKGGITDLKGDFGELSEKVAVLYAKDNPSLDDILSWESLYRAEVCEQYSTLSPASFDREHRIPIEDIYVPPDLSTYGWRERREKRLTLSSFFEHVYRAVLFGDPGGGKSSLVAKLAYEAGRNYGKGLFRGRSLTPVVVTLRGYYRQRSSAPCSIIDYMDIDARSKYQRPAPPGAFEYLALNGRVFVIFDGLDEVVDIASRKETVAAIESFCRQFPATPVLVTSRRIGYDHAPLDDRTFVAFSICRFSEAQVRAYITNWTRLDTKSSDRERQHNVAAFIEETQNIADLRSNALMLSLIATLYRGRGYIPKHRVDVYMQCTNLLFERWWDEMRGIKQIVPFESHMRPTVMHLAHWTYCSPDLHEGVKRSHWISNAASYLCPRRFEQRDEATQAAASFIDFCAGRAWVLTDVGTTERMENVFKFTHDTFLEFFAAEHMSRNHETPEELLDFLMPRIQVGQWHEPAHLALHIKNTQCEDVGTRVLPILLGKIDSLSQNDSVELVSFATRSLEYLVPSAEVVKNVVATAIRTCLQSGASRATLSEILHSLRRATEDNARVVSDALLWTIPIEVLNGDETEAIVATQFARSFTNEMSEGAERRRKLWWSIERQVYEECRERLVALGTVSASVAEGLLRVGQMDISEFLKCYGVKALFCKVGGFLTLVRAPSYAEYLVATAMAFEHLSDDELLRRGVEPNLSSLGKLLPRKGGEWIEEAETLLLRQELARAAAYCSKKKQREFELSATATFGGLCLVAGLVRRSPSEELNVIRRLTWKTRFVELAQALISSLANGKPSRALVASMQECGCDLKQQDIVAKWCDRKAQPFAEGSNRE